MIARLFAAGSLLLGLPAFAADQFHQEARVGLSEAEFARANTELFGQGLRLVDITVTESQGKPVIGAIWHRYEGMPAPTAERTKQQLARVFLKLDEAGLRAKGDQMAKEGSRVEVIDAYRAGGKTWFAASFTPPNEPAMQSIGAFLTEDQSGAMRDQALEHDHDFIRADAYGDGDTVKYFPVFVARGKSDIDVGMYDRTIAISADGAAKYFNGYQPLSITVFEVGDETRWFVLWDKTDLNRDFLLTDTAEDVRKRIASGGQILDLDSQAAYDGSVSYYAVVMGGKSDD
jgi:hypothetical protein